MRKLFFDKISNCTVGELIRDFDEMINSGLYNEYEIASLGFHLEHEKRKILAEKSNHPFNKYGAKTNMNDVITIIKNEKELLFKLQSNVNSILSINCGDAVCEQYVVEKLFPNVSNVIHTDIKLPEGDNCHGVLKKSAADALKDYSDVDLILCFQPKCSDRGYENIFKKNFKAKYLMYLGHYYHGGHSDPANLIMQITGKMTELFFATVVDCTYMDSDHLVIFERKEEKIPSKRKYDPSNTIELVIKRRR